MTRSWLKLLIAFVSAFALMLAVRALAFSIHGVTGEGLAPFYHHGDQLLINRCSYGLRIEGNRLLPYSRLMRRAVHKGDIIAFEAPDSTLSGLLIARCAAVPGDTHNPVDSRHLGFIPESSIVGRVVTVLYNRKNFWLQ